MDTTQLRERLLARRANLVLRNAKIEARLRRNGVGLAVDWPEQAQERENDEVLEGLDGAGRAEVLAIDSTLSRIDSGSFGVCGGCGEPIPEGRLAALPTATHCVGCD